MGDAASRNEEAARNVESQIAERAFALSQEDPAAAPEDNWLRAEREILGDGGDTQNEVSG